MRTTLDIDDDVLQAAKELAALRKTTAGTVLSELARRSLEPSGSSQGTRNGVPILQARPGERPVTLRVVQELRDDEPTTGDGG